MKLKILEQSYAIIRYAPDKDLSELTDNGNEFFSLTKTPNEISVICEETKTPNADWQKNDGGWRGFCLDAVFEFSEIGILKQVLNPLAEAKISILALATFDTDYVFIPGVDFERALDVLKKSGFTI